MGGALAKEAAAINPATNIVVEQIEHCARRVSGGQFAVLL
jgi:hypothetical protein